MQVAVVEKTFRIVGKGSLMAQFTFISSGTLQRTLQQFNSNLYFTCQSPTLAIAKRALNMN
ncbi:hypothetical protein ACET75_11925 [Aeromonas veronii]